MIDSHCHLAAREFEKDLPEVLERARQAGVTRMVCIGDTIAESEKCIELAERYPELFATVGVHPHAAKEWASRDLDRLSSLVSSSKKVKAIGEIGLDFHYNFSGKSDQLSAFSDQLLLAKELGIPAVVHCREAVDEVWKIVDDIRPPKLVIHCCTEKFEDVKRFLHRGYLLSFTGIATYKNGEVIRDTIRQCPLEQSMIETDAPYLAPVPHRGKRNEPSFVLEVAKLVSHLKQKPLEETDAITTRNTVGFFGL